MSTVRPLLRRYVDSLLDVPMRSVPAPARAGYTLWQRYWASLTGINPAPAPRHLQ